MNIPTEKLLYCLADAAVAVLIFRARRRADEPLWGWRSGNEDGTLSSVPHFLPGLAAIALVMLGELVCPVIFLDKETQA